jgi:PiT family inorganic phosphate transporter
VELAGLIVFVIVALGFDYTNGFHDAANAIATSVSTRALTPRVALAMAAVFNLIGALISTKVAATVGTGIIAPPHSLLLLFAAIVGAIVWNLITWYFGLPSSSTHALIGGLVGAAIAAAETVHWSGVVEHVIVPMVLSPIVGLVLGYLLMLAVLWVFRNGQPHRLNRGFRWAQVGSSGAMSLGHGLQDAQKTMGAITLALVVTGHEAAGSFHVPLWVIFAAAAAISLGTYTGGTRIMRTLGRRVIKLDPAAGFSAQTVASGVLFFTAYVFAAPISTTHVITSSVMGVGAQRKFSAVRWGLAGNILAAWIITLPAAGAVAAAVYGIGYAIVG